jgi:hypothetical protein
MEKVTAVNFSLAGPFLEAIWSTLDLLSTLCKVASLSLGAGKVQFKMLSSTGALLSRAKSEHL